MSSAPAHSQTTLDASSLAYRSTGASCPDKAWCLDEDGFVGTYIQVAEPASVSFTIRASKSKSETGSPKLALRVADFAASWPVTATGDGYGSHTQAWTLPAGTYCVRVENANNTPSGGPWAINIRDLTIVGAAVVNEPTDALALAAADTYVDHFRKGPAALTVMNGGQPLANASVRFRLKRHAFNFGTAVSGIGGRGSSWVANSNANEVNYRDFIIRNFNSIVPENAGKWFANERTRDTVTMDFLDGLVDFAVSNNKRIRMHGVLWDVSQPKWVNALQDAAINGATQQQRDAAKADLRAKISQRIRYFVKDRAARYCELDVINESVHQPKYYEIFGTDGVAGIYNEVKEAVRAAGGSTRLVPNEFEVLQGSLGLKDPYANWYRRHVENLRSAGGAVDGIGIQYYAVGSSEPEARTSHSPSLIAGVFNNLATTNLSLSLSEFGVQSYGSPTPQRSADLLADTLRLCFGHEKMATFIMWGFWRPRMWSTAPACALMDADWKITPAGMVWQQMTGVRNWNIPGLPVWTTDVSVVTDEQGRADFAGFYGDYEVISGDRRGQCTLTKGTTDCQVSVSGG